MLLQLWKNNLWVVVVVRLLLNVSSSRWKQEQTMSQLSRWPLTISRLRRDLVRLWWDVMTQDMAENDGWPSSFQLITKLLLTLFPNTTAVHLLKEFFTLVLKASRNSGSSLVSITGLIAASGFIFGQWGHANNCQWYRFYKPSITYFANTGQW